MDPVVSAASEKSLGFSVELLKRHVGYLYYYKDNVEELKKLVKDLQGARERVQHRVDEAKRNEEEIEADVRNWLEEVDKKIAELEKFLKGEDHRRAGCSILLFPHNLCLRYRIGRNAKKMAQKIKEDELLENKFDTVSYSPGPTAINDALSNIDFENFPSREEVFKAIMVALEDPTIRFLGVWGPGGVGKTTLVKEIAKKAMERKLFKMVVLANITKNPDLKKIQGELADMLGLSFKAESDVGRADHLRRRLKKEEHTLVILDDVWEVLDLKKLGIPFDNDYDDHDEDFLLSKRNDDLADFRVKGMPLFSYNLMKKEIFPHNDKGCKVLLTSRFKEVLSTQMDVNKTSIFFVRDLNQEEAVMFFKKVAMVPDESSNTELQHLASKIVKKCANLPMAIIAMGRALKNQRYSVWKDELKRLENHDGMLKIMESSVKLSYDHLESEELKCTFLLCAQMAHRPLIMDLVKYSIGLGIFQGVDTIRETRNRIEILIQKLKDSSLLLDSDSSDQFNMHDMVCEAALSIASKERNVFFKRDGKLDDWPEKYVFEKYTGISIHNCDIFDELPKGVNCPQLRLFHIDSTNPSLKIPDQFFEGMRELRVLVLSGIDLSCLPSSIKYLENLRKLCLERCQLQSNSLSVIGQLKKLRILSLSESEIENLPHDLGQLCKLQLFDISNCPKLKIIAPNILSNMTSLEELYMRKSIIQWGVETEKKHGQYATLSELKHLHQLRTLDIYIQTAAFLPIDLDFDKLDDYKIVIGDFNMLVVEDLKMPDKYEASRALAILELKDGTNIHSLKWIKFLLRKAEILFLGKLNGVQNVICELNLEGFPCLKHLSIVNNFEIRYIVNSMDLSRPQHVFPNLESMRLHKLENLEKICYSHLTDASFYKLKAIKINKCVRLKNLFSFYVAKLLTELERIEVSECRSLTEIVAIERCEDIDNELKDDMIKFPQLHALTLRSLPAFTSLYTKGKMLSFCQSKDNHDMSPQDTTMEKHSVDAPLSLFSRKVSVPNLESLELSLINIHKIWSDDQPLISPYFQKLISLKVKDCGNLRYLLSFSMAKSLVNLQSLFVSGCDMMEDIFSPEEIGMDEEKANEVFPMLKEIKIISMEKLKTLWHTQVGLNSFKSLDSIIIESCKKLATVFPHHMTGRYQSLGSLKVTSCESVEEIFDLKDNPKIDGGNEINLQHLEIENLPVLKHIWNTDPQGILNFKNIRIVCVKGCFNIENLLPLSVASGLINLESLFVGHCYQLKEIVTGDDRGSNESTVTFNYSQLTCVVFVYLPEVGSFYQGPHALEWPALKELVLLHCGQLKIPTAEATKLEGKPIILSEKVIENLEEMGIGHLETKLLQDYSYNLWMRHLKSLYFNELKSSTAEFFFRFLHRIPNLQELMLSRCLLKELFPRGSLDGHEKIGTAVPLKTLGISLSPFLNDIGFEHADSILGRVEFLFFDQCPRLTNLAPSSVSFFHLTTLVVSGCSGLKHLVASSTAKSLVQLASMKVISCGAMEEIVAWEHTEEEIAQEIVFSNLVTLELDYLLNLTSFCSSKKHVFAFPLLEKLAVRKCPIMKVFCEKLKSPPPNLQKVDVAVEEEDKWYWKGDINTTIQYMFTNKVVLEQTEFFLLSDRPESREIWHDKIVLPQDCFGKLRALLVVNCQFLKDFVIPSNILPHLKNLEALQVTSCNAVKVIFDINNMEMTKSKGIAFHLKKLTLNQLPYLERIWNKTSQGIVCFQNLQNVSVQNCDSLKAVFPTPLAKTLVKLEELYVGDCALLVEIAEREEADADADGATAEFVFSSLTSLALVLLPKLTCFYPGRHTLACPKLNVLVLLCAEMEKFTTKFGSNQEAHPHGQVSIPNNGQPLLNLRKVTPNLKVLTLTVEDAPMFWDGQFPPNSLHTLEFIQLPLYGADEEATSSFLRLLFQKLPNLQRLELLCSNNLKEIFPPQQSEVYDYVKKLARLKVLLLRLLYNLKSIGLEHSSQLPGTLECLSVLQCPGLTKLVHSAASFCNLKRIEMWECDGLVYLFTPSTAKSLVKLQTIIVQKCKSIKEIIAQEEGASTSSVENNEIIFKQLVFVVLCSLPSLVCFYSGNATLQFPNLHTVTTSQCPKMRTFSNGVIIAPSFLGLQALYDIDPNNYNPLIDANNFMHFHEDLNTTVQGLFQEINGVSGTDQTMQPTREGKGE